MVLAVSILESSDWNQMFARSCFCDVKTQSVLDVSFLLGSFSLSVVGRRAISSEY